jgi:hypothetical protein
MILRGKKQAEFLFMGQPPKKGTKNTEEVNRKANLGDELADCWWKLLTKVFVF